MCQAVLGPESGAVCGQTPALGEAVTGQDFCAVVGRTGSESRLGSPPGGGGHSAWLCGACRSLPGRVEKVRQTRYPKAWNANNFMGLKIGGKWDGLTE